MKQFSIYVADDNSKFEDKNQCMRYELLCDEVNRVMAVLKPRPNDDLAFKNGSGYLQQSIGICESVRKQFFTICAREIPYWEKIMRECAEGRRHISHAGWIISDCSFKCLRDAYDRMSCIDLTNGKEFGQSYFVTHQDEVIDEYE